MKMLDLAVSDEDWFRDRLALTGLADLAKTRRVSASRPCLINALLSGGTTRPQASTCLPGRSQ
ncbi:hypothetical protein A2U01_0094789 [Trifolium medium]|uniref:Uncharacterized protein n=1 Tax=Trifolium medium TaxID=97028 RepID=A0A392UP40_9FABA|nr:hypothetical protein [Trifolium medium]